jgi:hypothetical protein
MQYVGAVTGIAGCGSGGLPFANLDRLGSLPRFTRDSIYIGLKVRLCHEIFAFIDYYFIFCF